MSSSSSSGKKEKISATKRANSKVSVPRTSRIIHDHSGDCHRVAASAAPWMAGVLSVYATTLINGAIKQFKDENPKAATGRIHPIHLARFVADTPMLNRALKNSVIAPGQLLEPKVNTLAGRTRKFKKAKKTLGEARNEAIAEMKSARCVTADMPTETYIAAKKRKRSPMEEKAAKAKATKRKNKAVAGIKKARKEAAINAPPSPDF